MARKSSQSRPLKPLAYTLKQFREVIYPCSRSRANTYVQSGELETFVDHGRRMVLVTAARAFVRRRAAAGASATPPEVSAQKRAAGLKGRALQLAAMRGETP